MFIIVIHHYCVNSGITGVNGILSFREYPINTILLQFLSIGGKIGVTGFFIISGFFMVNKPFKVEKLLKFILQIFTWNVIVFLFLHFILGYEYKLNQVILDLTPIVPYIQESFIGSYFIIFLLSPIINRLISILSKRELIYLLIILISYFSLIPTFTIVSDTWHYVSWGITMYILGAYIKIYNISFENLKIWGLIISVLAIWSYILLCDFLGGFFANRWTFMIGNANKFFIFLSALSLFMIFKNLRIRTNKLINLSASAVFGVLLIHANSNTMRLWLWQDLLQNKIVYSTQTPLGFLVHLTLSCIAIYVLCTMMELCRINLIEKPLFEKIQNDYRLVSWFKRINIFFNNDK